MNIGCSCKNLVNENGQGNCLKNSPSSQHNGDKFCYVEMPSECSDLVASGTNPEEFLSEEACKQKGLIHYLISQIGETTIIQFI